MDDDASIDGSTFETMIDRRARSAAAASLNLVVAACPPRPRPRPLAASGELANATAVVHRHLGVCCQGVARPDFLREQLRVRPSFTSVSSVLSAHLLDGGAVFLDAQSVLDFWPWRIGSN